MNPSFIYLNLYEYIYKIFTQKIYYKFKNSNIKKIIIKKSKILIVKMHIIKIWVLFKILILKKKSTQEINKRIK